MPVIITEGYQPCAIGCITQLQASYYAATHNFGVEFEAKIARELAEFCMSFKTGRDGLWLACNPEIEGSIAIDGSHAERDGAHLRWFITSDKLRGQGVGKQLLSRALAFVDTRGYQSTYLWTFAGLDAARHLYESQGFRLVHESPGTQWGTVVREQRFERIAS